MKKIENMIMMKMMKGMTMIKMIRMMKRMKRMNLMIMMNEVDEDDKDYCQTVANGVRCAVAQLESGNAGDLRNGHRYVR